MYGDFVADLQRLLKETHLAVSPAALDAYLWLRGGFETLRAKPDAKINKELHEYFLRRSSQPLLKKMSGESRYPQRASDLVLHRVAAGAIARAHEATHVLRLRYSGSVRERGRRSKGAGRW